MWSLACKAAGQVPAGLRIGGRQRAEGVLRFGPDGRDFRPGGIGEGRGEGAVRGHGFAAVAGRFGARGRENGLPAKRDRLIAAQSWRKPGRVHSPDSTAPPAVAAFSMAPTCQPFASRCSAAARVLRPAPIRTASRLWAMILRPNDPRIIANASFLSSIIPARPEQAGHGSAGPVRPTGRRR